MKKVFITGEHGMIATAVTHYLLKERFSLVNWAYDCDENKSYINKYRNNTRELDITNKEEFITKVIRTRPDFIIHTAAYVNSDKCDKYEEEAIEVNIEGTKNVVEAANLVGAIVVFLGTTATYDPETYDGKSIVEETLQKPKTLYGKTKLEAEEIVLKKSLKRPIIIRPCFAFGGIMDKHLENVNPELYYLRDTSSNLTKTIYNEVCKIKQSVKFTLNSSFRKDYFSVDDLAFCIVKLIEKYENLKNLDYNISKNEPLVTYEYFEEIRSCLMKYVLNVNFESEKDYLKNHIVDNRRVLETLNLKGLYTTRKETIEDIVEKIKNGKYLINEKVLETH